MVPKYTSALAVEVLSPILIDCFVWALPIDICSSTQRVWNAIFAPFQTVLVR